MNEWNSFLNDLGSFGFPAIMCYLMWTFITQTVQNFTTTMQKNTQMIEKLCEQIDREGKKDDNQKAVD